MSQIQRLLEHLEEMMADAKGRRSQADATRDIQDWSYYEGKINFMDDLKEWIAANLSDEWQPIETAPKDGTRILSWDHHGACLVSYLEDAKGFWCSRYPRTPTHWQPLPEPPAGKEEA